MPAVLPVALPLPVLPVALPVPVLPAAPAPLEAPARSIVPRTSTWLSAYLRRSDSLPPSSLKVLAAPIADEEVLPLVEPVALPVLPPVLPLVLPVPLVPAVEPPEPIFALVSMKLPPDDDALPLVPAVPAVEPAVPEPVAPALPDPLFRHPVTVTCWFCRLVSDCDPDCPLDPVCALAPSASAVENTVPKRIVRFISCLQSGNQWFSLPPTCEVQAAVHAARPRDISGSTLARGMAVRATGSLRSPEGPRPAPRGPRSTRAEINVSGIRISHPDRIVFTHPRLSKLEVVQYYESVGEWILPHVVNRPLTLVHCPEGLAGPCHYLRHGKAWGPSVLRRVRIREKTKVGEYLVADSIAGVVALAQMGVLEIHTWNSTTEAVERPNRIVWDLDPGPSVTWREVVQMARLLRSVLDVLGLQVWVKTTGGQGLHVVMPVAPVHDWSQCLEFARAVARSLERSDPETVTTAFAKTGREEKILIDYLRNNRTNTSVAAFSTRARDGAPVSVPLDWSELGEARRQYSVGPIRRRLAQLRDDPWKEYWRCRQRISSRAMAAIGNL